MSELAYRCYRCGVIVDEHAVDLLGTSDCPAPDSHGHHGHRHLPCSPMSARITNPMATCDVVVAHILVVPNEATS